MVEDVCGMAFETSMLPARASRALSVSHSDGRRPASSGRSGAETLPSGSTGVKVEQPQLAVAGMAMQPQKQPSTIDDTCQHEELLEGPLASESN